MKIFENVRLGHVAGKPHSGEAAYRVLSPTDFSQAIAEITAWEGYAPTPLLSLESLASEIGVARIDYKDEGAAVRTGQLQGAGWLLCG